MTIKPNSVIHNSGFDSSNELKRQLSQARTTLNIPKHQPVPIGVGFLGWILDKTEISDDPRIPSVLNERPAAIWFAFGDDLGKWIKQVRECDVQKLEKTVIFVIVNSIKEALKAVNEWKVDVLVVQGKFMQKTHSVTHSLTHSLTLTRRA